MIINPICCLPPINDFPFIENTFKELDLYSLICAVGHKVNELVEQGNTIDKNLKALFDEAISTGAISFGLKSDLVSESGVLRIYVTGENANA